MRMQPTTHLLGATSNEDGSPAFATVDTGTGVVTPYTFPAPPHQGGYDDLYFLNGKAFIGASNPTLDASGNNVFPAVDQIKLNADHTISLTPILMGNATVTDVTTNTAVTLDLTHPDSLSTHGKGPLVLVSQRDSQLITIANPGGPAQPLHTPTLAPHPAPTAHPST